MIFVKFWPVIKRILAILSKRPSYIFKQIVGGISGIATQPQNGMRRLKMRPYGFLFCTKGVSKTCTSDTIIDVWTPTITSFLQSTNRFISIEAVLQMQVKTEILFQSTVSLEAFISEEVFSI